MDLNWAGIKYESLALEGKIEHEGTFFGAESKSHFFILQRYNGIVLQTYRAHQIESRMPRWPGMVWPR